MKNKYLHLACTLLVLALAVSISFGGGYQINEHGARAVGMGGAFVARASDGSAIFFNPAGLGFQKGINLMLGTTLIFPSTTFTGPTPLTTETSMKSQVFYPSNLYASFSMGDKWVFGLGVFSPYGLGSEWPNDWAGQQLAVKTDLQTFYINPTIAYQVSDKLSVGLGVSVILGSVKLIQRTGSGTTAGTLTLDGTGNGISFDVGVLYKATDQLSFGASYRSLADIEFSGSATFTNMGAAAAYFPGDPSGKATLPMPSNLFLGASFAATAELTLEADFQWVGWSSYDKLTLNIKDGPVFPLTGKPLQTSATLDKKWDNGYLFRIGGEYLVNNKLTVRAGYIMDISPQPPSKTEPMLPDADRNDFSIGGSYQISEKLHVDLSYLLVLFNERDSKTSLFPGTYKSNASLISIDFGLQL